MAENSEVQAQAAAALQAKEDARLMREAASDPTKIHVILDNEFEKKNYLKVHQKLTEVFFLNPNIESGWRLTRVAYSLSVTAAGQHELNYLNEGWAAAKKTLEMEGAREHPLVRKWAGILLASVVNTYEKTKDKLEASQQIREHLEACLTQLPNDCTALHAMGVYCFKISGLGFMEKAAAKIFFGKDISSKYSEALGFFKKVSENKKKPWMKNEWMIAQCLVLSSSVKDVNTAKAIMVKILASDSADALQEQIHAFCKKKKIKL